jgi:hypothetical protein
MTEPNSDHLTSASSEGQHGDSLHRDIMNLRAGLEPDWTLPEWTEHERSIYRIGHRDARHAAAELVAAWFAAWNRRAPAVPPNWKLVPETATREMMLAGAEHCFRMGNADPDDEREVKEQTYAARGCAIAAYSAMLSASPPPPEAASQTDSVNEGSAGATSGPSPA